MNRRLARPLALSLLVLSSVAVAQVFVYPRRADKSLVRYDHFEWFHIDILVGRDADKIEGHSVPRPMGVPAPPGTPENQDANRQETPLQGAPAPLERPSARGSSAFRLEREAAWRATYGALPSHALLAQLRAGEATDAGVSARPIAPVTDGGVSSELVPLTTDGGTLTVLPPSGGADAGTQSVSGAGPADGGAAVAESLARPDGGAWERELGPESGGVRLYFYERERDVAQRAVPLITSAYRYLVDQFDYVPSRTFPYILYSTYQEYLQTNLFPLSEGTLGVTSPLDLKLTLPYFGDARFFDLVSTHELAHQFTIQKVKSAAEKADVADPLMGMPLWFIEGLAEFYAQRGMDPEAEMLVRDLLVNPDFEKGYVLQDFFAEGPYGFLWIYKMGQARCTFLEETYGVGTLQRVLEDSPSLVGGYQSRPRVDGGFPGLLKKITGDSPRQISAKFENWLKRRGFTNYLSTTQNGAELEPLESADGYIDAMTSSPDGNLVLYRELDPETGQSKLLLLDPRYPSSRTTVTSDGVPGIESLHVVFGRNFALQNNQLAFIAESKGRDVLYVQRFEHDAALHDPPPVDTNPEIPSAAQRGMPHGSSAMSSVNLPADAGTVDPEPQWEAELDLEERKSYPLGRYGLVAAYSPAFSPDGRQLAFIGLTSEGVRDVYLLTLEGESAPVRLTNDLFAERQLTWGSSGITYTSDATSHGKHNLFRVGTAPGSAVTRLTTDAKDHLDPVELPDGRLLFTAYEAGRADVHELENGVITRRTDLGTGLFNLGPGVDGGLWGLLHRQGRRRPVRVPQDELLSLEASPQQPGATSQPLGSISLSGAERYRPFRLTNWELGPILGIVGGGTGGIAGQVFASATDRLRNHALMLQAAVFGSFKYADGILLYLNQEDRVSWGLGAFQSLRYRVDQTALPDTGAPFLLTSGERFFGARGMARYPFNRFVYVQGDLALGGANYFLSDVDRYLLSDRSYTGGGTQLLPYWQEANDGTRLQTEAAVSIGYDTLRYHYATGPISGSSVLLEVSGGWQPKDQETFGSVRLDAERYFSLFGRTHVVTRLGSGTAFGGKYARQFYLSTFDTLRGVEFGDENSILGRHYLYSTAELRVPLNALIRFVLLSDVEGIAGFDAGGVGNEWDQLWDKRVVDAVLGFNLGLGPILFRLHFAKPILVGKGAIAPSPNAEWVTNFSIGIAGFGGFFGRANPAYRSTR